MPKKVVDEFDEQVSPVMVSRIIVEAAVIEIYGDFPATTQGFTVGLLDGEPEISADFQDGTFTFTFYPTGNSSGAVVVAAGVGPTNAPATPGVAALSAVTINSITVTFPARPPLTDFLSLSRSTDNVTYAVILTGYLGGEVVVDAGLTTGQIYYYKVTAVNAAGSTDSAVTNATPSAVFDPATISNIEGRWRGSDFDAITDATEIAAWNDLSGLARTALAIAASPDRQTVRRNAIATTKTTVASALKQGLRYNNGSTLFNLATSDFSLFTVLKFKRITGTEDGYWSYGSTTSQAEMRLSRVVASGKLNLTYNGVGGWDTTPIVPIFKFMCLILVSAGGVETFYINGVAAAWDITPGALNANIQYLNLNSGFNLSANFLFGGETAEFIAYRKALSPAEINNLYANYALIRYPDVAVVGPTTINRTYVSDGDTNGIFYLIGTAFGAEAWMNPHTFKFLTVVFSSIGNGTEFELVDRATSDLYTANTASSWIAVDIGAARTLAPDRYSIRSRSGVAGGNIYIRNWKLQGSNNPASNSIANLAAATWVDLDVQVNNTTINAVNQWLTLPVTGAATYRWFRILQNGVNSLGSNFLMCAELELYGSFTYTY